MLAILTHETDVQNGCGECGEMGREKERVEEVVGKRNNSPSSTVPADQVLFNGCRALAAFGSGASGRLGEQSGIGLVIYDFRVIYIATGHRYRTAIGLVPGYIIIALAPGAPTARFVAKDASRIYIIIPQTPVRGAIPARTFLIYNSSLIMPLLLLSSADLGERHSSQLCWLTREPSPYGGLPATGPKEIRS